jgi:hypothetical protein
LTPCLVTGSLDILHREFDPSPESASWFVKTPRCAGCALVNVCDGAERGAVSRFGDDWVTPITSLPEGLVTRIPAAELDRFVSGQTGSVVQIALPDNLEAALAAIPAIAEFQARNPHIFMLA